MALRAAVVSGNWSNPAIWNGGVLPTTGDIVGSNGFIVTIDQNINVDLITNAAKTDSGFIPTMTSNTSPSGIVSASSVLNDSYPAWKAFDKNNGTFWASGGTTSVPQWIQYEFPTAVVVDKYILLATNTDAPVTWDFQAWDGSNWVTLQSIVNAPKVSSATTYTFTNTTAYTKYRMYIMAPFSQGYVAINELSLGQALSVSSVAAGGRFNINDGVNIVANQFEYDNASNVYNALFYHTGTGGITSLSGNLLTYTRQRRFLELAGTGTFNFTGTIRGESSNEQSVVYSSHSGTLNFTGDIYYLGSGSNAALCNFAGAGYNLTITGNIYNQSTATSGLYALQVLRCSGANSQMTIIGNLYNQTLNITSWDYFSTCLDTTIRTTVIGSLINSATLGYCVASSTDFLFMTGPFVASQYACLPYAVRRLFNIPTVNTYFEFVNNSTNGAIPPSVTVNKSRVVSPDSAADAPIPANVRSGVIYLEGNLVGTMAIPNAANVAFGVPVDNTTGTAALDAAGIWAVPLTSINTLNSIGRRVKNAATVETTGAQLESLIRANE